MSEWSYGIYNIKTLTMKYSIHPDSQSKQQKATLWFDTSKDCAPIIYINMNYKKLTVSLNKLNEAAQNE